MAVDQVAPRLQTAPAADALPAAPDPFFKVEDVHLAFGGLKVLQGAQLHVNKGEIVGLIGPNGAGKTTLFDVISGFRPNASGRVWMNGTDLMKRKAWERPWLGLGRTFQQVSLFPNQTIRDCVRTALHRRAPDQPVRSLLKAAFATAGSAAEEKRIAEKADEVIERVRLGDYALKLASDLSYGTLRMAELACIIAIEPELVLLDEPSSGIAQRETEALGPLLLELREELGATFVLIEHDMPLIMSISDRIYCLASGSVLAEGTPEEVQANTQVVEAYLGGSIDDATPAAPTSVLVDEAAPDEIVHEETTGPVPVVAANGSTSGRRRREPLRATRSNGNSA